MMSKYHNWIISREMNAVAAWRSPLRRSLSAVGVDVFFSEFFFNDFFFLFCFSSSLV